MELLMSGRKVVSLGNHPEGMRIVCREGSFWLTQAGDSRDYILRPGDSYTITNGRHVVVTALESGRFGMAQTQEMSRRKGALQCLNNLVKMVS